MTKINFGCGGNHLPGWNNHDIDVDITRKLPYPDAQADFIFAEHVVEHTTPQQAFQFFEECHRVLKPGGAVRIAVPSTTQIFHQSTPSYLAWLKKQGWGDGTAKSAVRSIVFNHGHQSIWSGELLVAMLGAVGFRSYAVQVSESAFPELRNLEGHWKVIGKEFNDLETCVAEGVK